MTVIDVPLTRDGIRKAIDELEDWKVGKLEPFADQVAMNLAVYVQLDMVANAHVGQIEQQPKWDSHEPGRLRESIHIVQNGPSDYSVIADATDNKGRPYAQKEQERQGGMRAEHDFASLVTNEERLPELAERVFVAADDWRSQL